MTDGTSKLENASISRSQNFSIISFFDKVLSGHKKLKGLE